MKLIPGKLYRVIQNFTVIPENYVELIGERTSFKTRTVEPEDILMFVENRYRDYIHELVFLKEETKVVCDEAEPDSYPERFLERV